MPFAARDYITHPKQWSDFLDNFKDYYAYGGQLDEEEVKNRSAEDWAKALERNYISASETNFNFNIKKMGYQARAKWCIGVAVLCVLLNTVPTYFLQRVIQEVQKTQVVSFPDIQKVEIVNPQARRVSPMSQERTTPLPAATPVQQMPATPPPTSAPVEQRPAPQKPEPPRNIRVREGQTTTTTPVPDTARFREQEK